MKHHLFPASRLLDLLDDICFSPIGLSFGDDRISLFLFHHHNQTNAIIKGGEYLFIVYFCIVISRIS